MSNLEFKAASAKTRRAIVPVGSLEQHGPHLPVSTDSIIAEHVSRLVASKTGGFVMPVIAYGISYEHSPMFNISLNSRTLSALAEDICKSLFENGIKEVIFVNGHHGNVGALQYLAQTTLNGAPRGSSVHSLHYWHQLKQEFDHAGFVETSILLHIAPELVRMDKAMPGLRRLGKSEAAYGTITNMPGSFPRLTGNGVWGDPRKATAEHGARMVQEIVEGLSLAISQL
ncbi:MAG: creatininase family protein [Nitrososphaera sp.]|jgi:creatinine amidohydrolase